MKSNTLNHTLQSCVVAISLLALTTGSKASTENAVGFGAQVGQLCALGSTGVGQPGAVICKNVMTGSTTQSVAVGATVSGPGGIAGSLVRHGRHVLVTNQSQGALLFEIVGGQLKSPVTLQTGGEGSLSGTLSDRGAYVLTGTRILFFPSGETMATSSQALLKADGSAAQVTLAGGHAYVSEKSGSLEAFSLGETVILSAAPRRLPEFPPASSLVSPGSRIWSYRRSHTWPAMPTNRLFRSSVGSTSPRLSQPRRSRPAGRQMMAAEKRV